jgi:hypothetical protein
MSEWQPSGRRSEETGRILDMAFDDAGQPVPVTMPEVYRQSELANAHCVAPGDKAPAPGHFRARDTLPKESFTFGDHR